ncbi:hypothetical protein PsAD5_04053 [Pseudovibrio sp. Ad5]|nr:hypothetical protein PsAD5_04053 [Pseudovibrio sp. Ad5]
MEPLFATLFGGHHVIPVRKLRALALILPTAFFCPAQRQLITSPRTGHKPLPAPKTRTSPFMKPAQQSASHSNAFVCVLSCFPAFFKDFIVQCGIKFRNELQLPSQVLILFFIKLLWIHTRLMIEVHMESLIFTSIGATTCTLRN